MVINTEWGAFGENGSIDFIRSRYDEEIDKTSINVGKQMYNVGYSCQRFNSQNLNFFSWFFSLKK